KKTRRDGTMSTSTGLENTEFAGALNPRTSPRAETNVTTIQLRAEKGPNRKSTKATLLHGESLRDPMIFRQLERAHLVHPCATLAACFFQTSRLEGSSPKTFTSLR